MSLTDLERAFSGGLRRIFGMADPEDDVLELTDPIAAKSATAQMAMVITPEDQKKIQKKFASLLQTNVSIPAGSLHMLGLKELRAKIGDEWPRLRDAVHQTTESVLQRSLNPADSFLRIGEDVFLLGFNGGDPRPAEQRVAEIAESIRQKLLGETGDGLITVEAVNGRLEKTDDWEIEFRIPETKPVRGKAVAAKKKPPLQPEPATASGSKPAFMAEKPAEIPYDPTDDPLVKNVSDMFSKVTERRNQRAGDVDIMYVPVWDAYHGILTTFSAVPARQNRAGIWIYEQDVLGHNPDDAQLLALDLKALVTALETMVELYENEFAIFLNTQLHYRSLASAPARERILEICQRIPEFLRKYLLVQIIDIPLDAPSSTIAMRLAQLRPFFRTVVVRAPSLKTDISIYFPLGVKAVSYPAGGNQDPKEIVRYLSDYAKKGMAAKVHITAEYVADIEVARLLKEAGITNIGGGVVGSPISMPDNMRRCGIKDFPLC